MDVLSRIKGLVVRGQVRFTRKAQDEMEADDLTRGEVAESIVNASVIEKVLASRRPHHGRKREKLYVIKGFSYGGTLIYTKGKVARQDGREVFYVFISAKIATYGDEA